MSVIKAATTVISEAPRFLAPGTYGPFTSGAVQLSQNGYLVTFTNSTDWPTSGDVANVTVEALVNGVWQFDAGLTLPPGPWKVRFGGTTNQITWQVGEPPAATKLRATLQMLQGATIGVSVAAL